MALVKTTIGLVILMVIVLGAALMALQCSQGEQIRANQRKLLYETDHDALYQAALEVLQNPGRYRPDPAWRPPSPQSPDPQDPEMPPAIRSLDPSWLAIQEDHLRIELAGGHYHFGVRAFLPGVQGHGTAELREGLWYYASDGFIPPREQQGGD